jgi:hypothetical protein
VEQERAEKIAMRQAGVMPVPEATPGAVVTPETAPMHAAHAALIASMKERRN